MKAIFIFIFFLANILHAEPIAGESQVVLKSESFTQKHQSSYGIADNYALVVAQHQIYADSCLFFYYGTKVGIVLEDYAAENGFGPKPDQYGFLYKADAGISYKLGKYYTVKGVLNLEGSRIINELNHFSESMIHLGYRYRF